MFLNKIFASDKLAAPTQLGGKWSICRHYGRGFEKHGSHCVYFVAVFRGGRRTRSGRTRVPSHLRAGTSMTKSTGFGRDCVTDARG